MKVEINWNEIVKYPIDNRIKTEDENWKYPFIEKSGRRKVMLYLSYNDMLLGEPPIATITFNSKLLRDYMYERESDKIYEAFLKEYERAFKLLVEYKEKLLNEKNYYCTYSDDLSDLIKFRTIFNLLRW